MKLPMKGYAVIEGDDERLALWDYRMPICWLKSQAEQDMRDRCIDGKVIEVEIRPAPKRKGRR